MKRLIAILSVVAAIFCSCIMVSYSNSPPLIMMGDTAFPINSDSIRLESEVIKIHYGSHKVNEWSTGHEVEVLFNFRNTGPEADLDIGFPNTANYNEKLRDFQALDYPSMTPYSTEIKSGGTLPEHDTYMYTSMYTWKMHFKENEQKSLYVKYWFEGTSHFGGADYILVTGALWKDRIDKIDVYVDFPQPAAFPCIKASPENYYYNGKGIEWHFENIEPDFNLFVDFTEYSPAFKLRDEYYKPRWADSRDDYKWDHYFYNIDFSPYDYEMQQMPIYHLQDMQLIRTIVEDIKKTNQCVINEIYARNGYTFESEEWESVFGEALWYTPNPYFSHEKFNSMEKSNISYIREFEEAVRTDVEDLELLESLEEFENKYSVVSQYQYYQYNYENLKLEKDRIRGIKSLNSHAVSLDPEYTPSSGHLPVEISDEPKSVDSLGGVDPIKILAVSNKSQLLLYSEGVYIKNDQGNLKPIFRYTPYVRKIDNTPIYYYATVPQIHDEMKASPRGNYFTIGNNYGLDEYSGITGNVVYMVNINERAADQAAYILGNGNFDDFNVWWSPSEKVFCFQNQRKDPKVLRIYDTEKKVLINCRLPEDKIDNLGVSDDMRVVIQHKDTIYYIDAGSGLENTGNHPKKIIEFSGKTHEFSGTLIGVGKGGFYFYRDNDIFLVEFNNLEPVAANKVNTSIWKSVKLSDTLYFLYGGVHRLSVYNTADNRVYNYDSLDYYSSIKPSPSGDKLYVYKEYYSPSEDKSIKEAYVVFSGQDQDKPIQTGDKITEWIDNDNLAIRIYNKYSKPLENPLLEYKYNVLTGRRSLSDIRIDTFKSRIVQELETGQYNLTYENNKRYSRLKDELLSNAYITRDTTKIYIDENSLSERDDPLEKGSLVGILKISEEMSKVCYITGNNILGSGWIRNLDYSVNADTTKLIQCFIYDAKVYELEDDAGGKSKGSEKKVILHSCSSEAKILDRKPGWLYINAADTVFGWVEEHEAVYDFPIKAATPSGNNTSGTEGNDSSTSNNTGKMVNIKALIPLSVIAVGSGIYLLWKRRR